MTPIQQLSYHHCEAMLREPHIQQKVGAAFAESKAQKDVKLQTLCPSEIKEIMNYRVSKTDDCDFALESFMYLGAKGADD